jgi:hypothetical protein
MILNSYYMPIVATGKKFRSVACLQHEREKVRLYGPNRVTKEEAEKDSTIMAAFQKKHSSESDYYMKLRAFVDELRLEAGFRPSGSGIPGPAPNRKPKRELPKRKYTKKLKEIGNDGSVSASYFGVPGLPAALMNFRHNLSAPSMNALGVPTNIYGIQELRGTEGLNRIRKALGQALPTPLCTPLLLNEGQAQFLFSTMTDRVRRCECRDAVVAEVAVQLRSFPTGPAEDAANPLNLGCALRSVRTLLISLAQSAACLKEGMGVGEHIEAFSTAVGTYMGLIAGVGPQSAHSNI